MIRLEQIQNHKHTNSLSHGWDYPVSNQKTLNEYVNLYLNQKTLNRISYWIIVNKKPIGVFTIIFHPDYQAWQTSTFISKPFRGKNINTILKHSVIKAFKKINIPLIATISVTNRRSIKAMRKITKNHGNSHLRKI